MNFTFDGERVPANQGESVAAALTAAGHMRLRHGKAGGPRGLFCGMGVCYDCLMGKYGHCRDLRCVGTVNTWDGAYAQYVVMPARHVFHLPDNVSFDNGAMIEPAATALYSVVRSGLTVGDTVLVQGSGPIGIAAAKLAKLCGASKVAITGRKDPKLRMALDLGVDSAVNLTKTSLEDGLRQAMGEWGVDRVVEASGSIELLKQSMKVINTGGVVSVVAFYERVANDVDVDSLVFGDATVTGVAGSLGMYRPILRLMSAGMLDMTSLVTDRYALDDVPEALRGIKEGADARVKMMIEMD